MIRRLHGVVPADPREAALLKRLADALRAEERALAALENIRRARRTVRL